MWMGEVATALAAVMPTNSKENRMLKQTAIAAALLVAGGMASTASAEGDPAAGERVYRQCMACHVLDAEQNRVGPHLVGIFGREAGAVDGFNYSPAMADSGIVWDDDTIGEYLADPRGYIPGNRMAFAGLRNPEQIADVIAYMRSKQ
jgi:cytochrome c2